MTITPELTNRVKEAIYCLRNGGEDDPVVVDRPDHREDDEDDLSTRLYVADDCDFCYVPGNEGQPMLSTAHAIAGSGKLISDLYDLVVEQAKQLAAEASQPTAATRDVLAERRRQVEKEGYTFAHDDTDESATDHLGHTPMVLAAACYLTTYPVELYPGAVEDRRRHGGGTWYHLTLWPWDALAYKPYCGRRGQLVKAGALILAEIERLDRAAPKSGA